MTVRPHSFFLPGAPMTSMLILCFVLNFLKSPWLSVAYRADPTWSKQRAQPPYWLPFLQHGWLQPQTCLALPWLLCLPFVAIPVPFELDDCFWLADFLTRNTPQCFSTGVLLESNAEHFFAELNLSSGCRLCTIPCHAHLRLGRFCSLGDDQKMDTTLQTDPSLRWGAGA